MKERFRLLKSNVTSTVYICSLPIGHDDDVSIRVKACLAEVHAIFCEDTRVTKAFLSRCNILGSQTLYRMDQYQENKTMGQLDRSISKGDVAYVTDAGSPGLSDPGSRLVEYALSKNYAVSVLPGASALTAFISGAGISFSSFYFGGYFPKKVSQMNRAIEDLMDGHQVGIWFESPRRILKTMAVLNDQCPNAPMVIAKEITKPYEHFYKGVASDIYKQLKKANTNGEWVLLLDARHIYLDDADQYAAIALELKRAQLNGKQVKQLAPLFKCSKNRLHDCFQSL